jgi:hypothetical protein
MRDGSLAPLGGSGKTVEIDETAQRKIAGAPKRVRRAMRRLPSHRVHTTRVALGTNDETRALRALKGVVGKRLTYRT